MTDSLVSHHCPPALGEFAKIAPGVRWIRIPMPYRLDHTNVWAIDDDGGWALVDTGVRTEDAISAWEELIAKPPLTGPLTRVLVTHMHSDHIGLAGWFARRYGVRVWISSLEYQMCRALVSESSQEAPADALQFYRGAGWGEAAIQGYRARFGCLGTRIYALPDSFRRLQDGMKLQIGKHAWEVVTGHGHSPEHSCLYCPALKLLISGDQVLPRSSSNVSVFPLQPDANPMAAWFASMERLKQRVPDEVLVAPGHYDVFNGLHARIEQLLHKQHEAVERLLALLKRPHRVVDVFSALFRSRILQADPEQLELATGEAMANLNYLIGVGKVVRKLQDGVGWYRKL